MTQGNVSHMDANGMLCELEEIEHTIVASEAILAILRGRRDLIENAIDEITRPSKLAESIPTSTAMRRGYEYRGQYHPTSTKKELYLGIVRSVWREFPNRRQDIAAEVKRASYNRSYFATDRCALFDGWPDWKARKYSVELVDGWFVDINLSQKQMQAVLRIVTHIAGLSWGSDVRPYWDVAGANA